MNHDYLKHLSQYFNLGSSKQDPQRVYGGLLHIMWRIDTDKASYAVKQLSKDINLSNERIVKNYELSEHITSRFIALGIPGVSAIDKSGKYLLMIDGFGFLVYPWVDAKVLDQHIVLENHALKIAAILAKMHGLNLNEPEITGLKFAIHTKEDILESIDKAESYDCPFVNALRKNQICGYKQSSLK